jgi:hypothetical protein
LQKMVGMDENLGTSRCRIADQRQQL